MCIKICHRRNIGYAKCGKSVGFDRSTALYLALEQAALEAVIFDNMKFSALPVIIPPGEFLLTLGHISNSVRTSSLQK